ncbi:glycosyltransferase family 39 protein [Paracoccus sp. CPCC 101403]|uniref:Glycosyltransferase family 39 protein n=1 Tax=Paracoccus broussonetiae TaxID=3075834 RepID=A0ABU3EGM9_9RHOB|nr:glycosyltransferase family 39 protein [Paracoccus sp. CPCC 101403]MDT1063375.1 glycosyltransferase family 39 protein [Paracoccus sp. CPCC 101403]
MTMTGTRSTQPSRLAALGDIFRDSQLQLALAMFAAMAVLGILLRPALPIDETRYLTVAWEMRTGHDWLVPHLNGHAYSDKPPLLFWLINLVWLVTGPSEIAARLVAPAFGLLTILATAQLGARLYPAQPELGGRAALILSSSLGFSLYAGLTMFDSMLALATVLGVLALSSIPDGRGDQARPWLLLGVALAFGGLAKGPVILLHLMPVTLTTLMWKRIPARNLTKGVAIALLTGVGIVSLWLVPTLARSGGEYREAILWTQSAGRVVQSFAHQRPVWYLLATLPLLLWPWAWSPTVWREARFPQPLPVWIGATLIIFSLISGKQAHYLLPVLPAFALAFAPALASARRGAPLAAMVPAAAAVLLLAVVAGVGPHTLAIAADPLPMALLVTGTMIVVALMLARGGLPVCVAAPLVVVSLSCLFLGRMGEAYDATPMARRIAPHDQDGIGLVDGRYHGQFGFVGRLREPLTLLDPAADGTAWLQACPGRILIGPVDNGPGLPSDTVDFRGETWGTWLPRSSDQINSKGGAKCR